MQFLFMLAFRIYFLTFTYNIVVNVSHFVNVICKKELLFQVTPFYFHIYLYKESKTNVSIKSLSNLFSFIFTNINLFFRNKFIIFNIKSPRKIFRLFSIIYSYSCSFNNFKVFFTFICYI